MDKLTGISDDELILLIKRGNEAAFTELYNRYWQPMFSVAAKKTGSMEDAEGIVQEIFLDIWKRKETILIQSEVRAYLSVAVKYKVINFLAKKKNANQYKDKIRESLPGADYSTEEWIDFESLKDHLSQLVARLPEKCKLVYELSREQGYSQKKISDELNISEKTVEAHLTRALKTLRKGIFKHHSFFDIFL